jgi:hypothetical protein
MPPVLSAAGPSYSMRFLAFLGALSTVGAFVVPAPRMARGQVSALCG